ncbi:MAG: type II toxin-antitoxin system RelE/ParE family toxin [Rhodospirillales bacterium]
MSSYRLRALALEDIREIAQYTQQNWGIKQRDRYLDGLFRCFGNSAQTPALGMAREDIAPSLRSFRTGRHLVIYLPAEDGVQIVRVLHESMDVRRHLEP